MFLLKTSSIRSGSARCSMAARSWSRYPSCGQWKSVITRRCPSSISGPSIRIDLRSGTTSQASYPKVDRWTRRTSSTSSPPSSAMSKYPSQSNFSTDEIPLSLTLYLYILVISIGTQQSDSAQRSWAAILGCDPGQRSLTAILSSDSPQRSDISLPNTLFSSDF